MSSDEAQRRRALTLVGVALLAGFVLRVEYFRELILSPFGRHLILDAEWYDQIARRIVDGAVLAEGRAYFRPPGYPFFLAGVYSLFDLRVDAARILQWVLGLGHVVLCFLIARRTHGERVAIVTAFLAATYGMFVYFEGEILTTALGTLLSTTCVLLLLESDHRSSALLAGLAGLALGLAATAHATALVVAPVAFFWVLVGGRPGRIWRTVALVVGVVIPVGAVTARNVAEGGEFVLLGTQGGINFYIGNNETSDGKSALAPGLAEAEQTLQPDGEYRDTIEVAARTLAERELGRELTAGEIDRFWYGKGWSWFREHPIPALTLLMRKTVFFWNGYEISNNRDLRDQARRFTPILRLFLIQWALILPLAWLGLVRPPASPRARPRALLVGAVAVYSLAIIAFFVCARYRQPAVAWLMPFAAAGMIRLWDDVLGVRKEPGRLLWTAALVVAFFVVTNPRFATSTGLADVTTDRDAPFHRFNLAVLYDRDGDLDRAIAEYRATLETGVQDPRVLLNLGNALARTGRAEEARDEYRKLMRMSPDYTAAVRSNLGIIAGQEGDWREAIRQFEECLDHDPSNRGALLGLGVAYLRVGRFDDAILVYRKALALRLPPEHKLRANLAVAYLETGLLDEALREALASERLAPNDVATLVTLVKIRGLRGETERAEGVAARARELAGGAPAAERAIEEALAVSR